MRIFFAGVLFLAVAPSFAASAAPVFKPGTAVTDQYRIGKVNVTRGIFAGDPAWKIALPADAFYVAVLGTAKTWNAARSACRLLAPRGAWDLPQEVDLMFIQTARVSHPLVTLGPVSMYAAWLRMDNDADDAQYMKGKDAILMGAWPDASNDPALGSLSGFIGSAQKQLPTIKDPAELRATQELVSRLSPGVDIYCVSRKIH